MKTVQKMILLYCHAHHREGEALCSECRQLQDYALKRLRRCPFGEHKSTCSNCAVHCYNDSMRKRIVEVMRYSGPRMLLHHPLLAVAHLIDEKRTKKKG